MYQESLSRLLFIQGRKEIKNEIEGTNKYFGISLAFKQYFCKLLVKDLTNDSNNDFHESSNSHLSFELPPCALPASMWLPQMSLL